MLTRQVIRLNEFLEEKKDHIAGASVLFIGMVRNHSEGKKVTCLEYEAYESMAEKILLNLTDEARSSWPVHQIRLVHRLGYVRLGEIAVAIEVTAAHRDEAYQASRFLIEEIKHKVPIWKREFFEDGTSHWSSCGQQTQVSEPATQRESVIARRPKADEAIPYSDRKMFR